MDEDGMVYMYSGISHSHKKQSPAILAKWMGLQNIMLNEDRQKHFLENIYMWNLKLQMCMQNRNRFTDI